MVSRHKTDSQPDITAAVDAITAQFYSTASERVDTPKTTSTPTSGSNDGIPADDAGSPPSIDTYLAFSSAHHGSNQLLLGVLLFFTLIVGVWGFLWYQTVLQTPLQESFDLSAFSTEIDDLSDVFAAIDAEQIEQKKQTTEATLKSDLSTALRKQYGATVLGATTTTTTTVTTTE